MSFNAEDYLMHHGVKGQKWGVRNYQYTDGSLTPLGYIHYGYGGNNASGFKKKLADRYVKSKVNKNMKDFSKRDRYLRKGTDFYRIQTSNKYESSHAFYATYKNDDVKKYIGLFGKQLKARANAVARAAEKRAEQSGSEEDIANAKTLRDIADKMSVYHLKINSESKLKIPSDVNAAHIMETCMKNSKDFAQDLKDSITNEQTRMKRPAQQRLFKEALSAMKKSPEKMSEPEKISLYKAFNLTLVTHNNDYNLRSHDKFYNALKKNGYSALIDINDKTYSSYHAKAPVIVFDTAKVRLQSVTGLNQKKTDELYRIYTARRIRDEVREQSVGGLAREFNEKMAVVRDTIDNAVYDFLNK